MRHSKADATTLWNSYSAITDTTAKAAINSATVYTWVDASRATNTDVTYEAIANRLYGLSTGSSGVYSPFLNPETKQSSWVLFASVAAAAMAGAIIFYTLRKRKHE
jgi:lysozyme family protein